MISEEIALGKSCNLRYFSLFEINFSTLKKLLTLQNMIFDYLLICAPKSISQEDIFNSMKEYIKVDIEEYTTVNWPTTVVKGSLDGKIVIVLSFYEELYSVGISLFFNPDLYGLK